ncbi:hypothetical protein AMK26_08145 [Streptomyces sp. CB03234]|uniref:hypothetical protein n=1 Tax=Streptomyces sp. (strain CB03234) TaxID=1703937 RepID=UPI000939A6AD|nr:hypothetical protein [Streptomyces sp. CB03234]OKK06047.1 hypothetical protein AMK26_08145 [Streptomyces sp. CB03234]
MPDRRRQSTESPSTSTDENNPFAPPPEGRPDQPWQPRHPENGGDSGADSGSDSGSGTGSDSGSGSGSGSDERPERPAWGSQWSPRQPGRSSGGFGSRPSGDQQGGGQGPGGPEAPAPRWDPTDPAQRRARYALLSGMWAFFFAIFDFPEIALLLGALALYWGISSLRGAPRPAAAGQVATTGSPAPAGPPPGSGRPQTTAAVSGLVTAALALMIVAATFTIQLVYRDYYACVDDALTKTGQLSCNELLPEPLRDVFGVPE